MSFHGFKHDLHKWEKNPTKIPLLCSKRDFPHWILLYSSSWGQKKERLFHPGFEVHLGTPGQREFGGLRGGSGDNQTFPSWFKGFKGRMSTELWRRQGTAAFVCTQGRRDQKSMEMSEVWPALTFITWQRWQSRIRVRNWTLWSQRVHSNWHSMIFLEKGFF